MSINAKSSRNLVLIRDPAYADLLRPDRLREVLPESDITCPADNIAERVCHLLVAATTGSTATGVRVDWIGVPTEVAGTDDMPDMGLEYTLPRWGERLAHALGFLHGMQKTSDGPPSSRYAPVPQIISADDPDPPGGALRIRVYFGTSSPAIAARVRADRDLPGLALVVADPDVIAGATTQHLRVRDSSTAPADEWMDGLGDKRLDTDHPVLNRTVVVDPLRFGYDISLVTDDISSQGARTFDLTYNLMFFNEDRPVIGWLPGAPMAESARRERRFLLRSREAAQEKNAPTQLLKKQISHRYSSEAAVQHMMYLLNTLKFELVRTVQAPSLPAFPLDAERTVGKAEHEHWCRRRWTYGPPGRRTEVRIASHSSSHIGEKSYDELAELEQDPDAPGRFAASYNNRLLTETYPAIAAFWGYEIRPHS